MRYSSKILAPDTDEFGTNMLILYGCPLSNNTKQVITNMNLIWFDFDDYI